MKTYAQLLAFATKLALNASADNQSLLSTLMDEQHRLLIEKYFDNETQVTMTTIGGATLTLTAAPIAGATSATLTAAWANPTNTQYATFSDGEMRSILFTYNSTAITWSVGLTTASKTTLLTVGVQDYYIPADVSKITNSTITIGQMKFVPAPVQSRDEWDRINFLPYSNDIPAYFYIYNGKVEFFPVPSTTGNIITINYKRRVPDLSYAWYGASFLPWVAGNAPIDYSKGNVTTATAGSTAIVGTATAWGATGGFPTGVDISWANLFLKINPPYGDGISYLIRSFTNDLNLTLVNAIVNAPNITSATTYSIGQVPLLNEDFHPLIAYGALKMYYSSIVPDANRYKMFSTEYESRLKLLEDYAGTKQINVNLGDSPAMVNPNLFAFGNSGNT